MHSLEELGWSVEHAAHLAGLGDPLLSPARVTAEHRDRYDVWTDAGERSARPSGRLRHLSTEREEMPAVGDWVAIATEPHDGEVLIHHVLPRRTALIRREAGVRTVAQVLAANLDTVLLVTSANHDFNPSRIERALAIIWDSGARPVLIVNKADLCPDLDRFRLDAEAAAPGVTVLTVSALTGDGVAELDRFLTPTSTAALIGSSGVGKSTLINRLAGESILATRDIRAVDGKGRHTTTHRQLVRLPGGALLVDTPGMREIGLWADDAAVEETFPDIEALAATCRFRDCRHEHEPGCGVRAAIEDGRLEERRFRSYLKLRREAAYLARRQDRRAQAEEERRWKQITKAHRRRNRESGQRA